MAPLMTLAASVLVSIEGIFRESRHGAAFGGTQPHSRSVEGRSVCAAQMVFRRVVMGAPSRIRTYAHGSGGRCSLP